MTKIEEFLQKKFDDQHLANLQCAAEDGTLVYHDCNRCLLHHVEGNYSFTKWEDKDAALAKAAELEFMGLSGDPGNWPFTKEHEASRREALLPLIHAEWARRRKPDPVITLAGPGIAWIEECQPIPQDTEIGCLR